MKKIFLFLLALFTLILSCKKENSNWRKYAVTFSNLKIDKTSALSATVHYSLLLEGTPMPEILEFGLIVSSDAEASFYNKRYPNTQSANQTKYVQYLSNLEGGTNWFVRPYAVTSRDTILGEIGTFESGSYFTVGSGVYDIEGNFYRTVQIGQQEWMSENLISRTFCNGDTLTVAHNPAIVNQLSDSLLITLSRLFDPSNDSIYGKYYPGKIAFDTRNICPCGWRIPTKNDIIELANYVGNNEYLGGKMKSVGILEEGTGFWKYPNAQGNNLTGLNIHPSGIFSRGLNSFFYFQEISQTMIIEKYPNASGVLIDIPASIALRFIRREIDIWGIGDNLDYVNIRCIRN